MIASIIRELNIRRHELDEQPINTVYFGGGTPSLLSYDEIMRIFDAIWSNYRADAISEITLEANPDDFSNGFIDDVSKSPINRLSLGIQSFFDEDLQFMNRAHNASQAERCVKEAQDKGLDNISVDLIYAIPESTVDRWKKNVALALSLQVPHISSYCMTIEEKTTFGNWEKKGRISQLPDEHAREQYLYLVNALQDAGILQYEISNFSKPKFQSQHNGNYWSGIPYLGVGPSAHSFDGKKKRRWNVSNNSLYLKGIHEDRVFWEEELLTARDRYNETIMTSLRTIQGIDLVQLKDDFDIDLLSLFEAHIHNIINNGSAKIEQQHLRLTTQGLFIADKIASDFFLLEEIQ